MQSIWYLRSFDFRNLMYMFAEFTDDFGKTHNVKSAPFFDYSEGSLVKVYYDNSFIFKYYVDTNDIKRADTVQPIKLGFKGFSS